SAACHELDAIAGRKQLALFDADHVLEQPPRDGARGPVRERQPFADLDGRGVVRQPDEPELAAPIQDPKLPPWRPGKKTLTLTNDTSRTAKPKNGRGAPRRTRHPTPRARR